jgi:hypothetical protein
MMRQRPIQTQDLTPAPALRLGDPRTTTILSF